MSEPSRGQTQTRRLPITIAWWYQQPHIADNYGAPTPQTVSHFARFIEIVSLTTILLGSRCTTKHRLPCFDRSFLWSSAVRKRSEGKGEGDADGQGQAEARVHRAFARGRRLELGTDERSFRLGTARGILFPTRREVHKSRDGIRQH